MGEVHKNKVEAFSACKALCLQLQREKNLNIICLHNDHGKEFENSQFAEFCLVEGIHYEFSAPITPQQNGVVERKNRILHEMARQCFMPMLYPIISRLKISV